MRILQAAKRIAIILLAPIVALLFASFGLWLYARYLQIDLEDRLPPPGQMIDIGTHSLHLDCRGNGDVTIILEAGSSSWSTHWERVHVSLSNDYRVCSYDRAGLGWSEPGPEPRNTDTLVAELEQLLAASIEQPPYIVIGTSYGGNLAWLFAQRNLHEVAGLVVIESPTLEFMQWRRSQRFIPSDRLRKFLSPVLAMVMSASEIVWPRDLERFPYTEFSAKARTVMADAAFRSRMKYWSLQEMIEPSNMGRMISLGDLPTVVVQAVYSEFSSEQWDQSQRELLAGSTRSQLILADDATHIVHMERPEIVADAVSVILLSNR